MSRDRGVVYVAISGNRPGFFDECLRSIAALRACSTLPVTVFTDHPALLARALAGVPEVAVVPLEASRSPFKLKVEAQLRAPYARHLFLDTDTYPLADPSDLLDRLDTQDLAIANAPRRAPDPADPTGRRTVISGCDGQGLNTGVFALRKSPAVLDLLSEWQAAVEAVADGDLRQGRGDQLYFNRLYLAGRLQALGIGLEVLDNRVHNVRPGMLPLLRAAGLLGQIRLLHVKHTPAELGAAWPELAGAPALAAAARVPPLRTPAPADMSAAAPGHPDRTPG